VNETVVLLHGIFRTSRSMRGLEKYLSGKNYQVININYPSTHHPLEELVKIIHKQIPQSSIVHFVGYSLGALLIRAYLAKYRPENLGRVVMYGPPNKGSEVADFLKNFLLYKKLYGPAGQQLITKQNAIAHIFAPVDYELGIIAGNRTIDPICYFILPRPNDGKVSIISTKLDGMKEHIVIPATHTFFPQNKKAWELTYKFLKIGSFA